MEQRKIVLIGKTGDGKSSTGNTVLGEHVFSTKASANAATAKSGLVDGRKITVVDTPGFFDTEREDEEIKSEIIKALIECAPAVHAFVVVLKVGRYTRHENEVVQKFLDTMKGEYVLKHTVILFTYGEELEGQTIETFVKANSKLQELVDKCGGRCLVLDNKHWNGRDSGNESNRVQVKNLLDTIDEMVKENGCFTNEVYQKVEEKIQEVMKIDEDNLPPEEKREKAKGIVKKMMLQVVGATTGMLIGALLGVGVALIAVQVSGLQALRPVNALLQAKMTGGAAAVQAAVEGGAAAVQATVEGGAATAGGAAAAAQAAVKGGAAAGAAAGVAAGVAAGAGVGAGIATAVGVLKASALIGAVVGGVTGWTAAEEADSVYDAMTKAAKLNYENATVVVEKSESGKKKASVTPDTQNSMMDVPPIGPSAESSGVCEGLGQFTGNRAANSQKAWARKTPAPLTDEEEMEEEY